MSGDRSGSDELDPSTGGDELTSEAMRDVRSTNGLELSESFTAQEVTGASNGRPGGYPMPPSDENDKAWGQPTPHERPERPSYPQSMTRVDPPLITGGKPRTLEDLYARYPVGNGEYKLRIKRLAPRTAAGFPVAGTLRDVYQRLTMDEFRTRFGGEKYEVLVLGPSQARDAVPGRDFQTYASIEVTVPGPPVLGEDSLPMPEMDPMTQQRYPGAYPSGAYQIPMSPEVRIKEIDVQARERERQEVREAEFVRRSLDAQRTPDSVVGAMQSMNEKAMSDQRAAYEQQVVDLRGMAEKLRERVTQLELELGNARQTIVLKETEAAKNMHLTETKLSADVEKRYQEQIANIRQEHAREVNELKDRFTRESGEAKDRFAVELKQLTERYRDDLDKEKKFLQMQLDQARHEVTVKMAEQQQARTQFEGDAMKERERLRDEQNRREQSVRDMHQIQLDNMKNGYEARIQELDRSYKREMDSLREQREREIAAVRDQAQGRAQFAKDTAEFKLQSTDSELHRLRTDIARLERENDTLKAQVHKPFLQALEEAEKTAGVLGYTKGEEKEGSEGPFDWKQQLANGVQELIRNGPEIAEKFVQARAANVAAAAVVAQQQAQQQMGAPLPPPAPPQLMRRRLPPPPGAMSRIPPVPGAPSMGIPPMVSGPPPAPMAPGFAAPAVIMAESRQYGPLPPPVNEYAVATPPPQGAPMPVATTDMLPAATHQPGDWVPPGPPMRFVPPAAPVSQPAPQPQAVAPVATPMQQAPQPQPQPATQQPPTAARAPQVPGQEAIVQFVEQLDAAIKGNLITPKQFAEGVVQSIGRDMTVQLLTQMPADQFISLVSAAPEGQQTAIVRRDGQKYVRAVWEEAQKIVGAVAAA